VHGACLLWQGLLVWSFFDVVFSSSLALISTKQYKYKNYINEYLIKLNLPVFWSVLWFDVVFKWFSPSVVVGTFFAFTYETSIMRTKSMNTEIIANGNLIVLVVSSVSVEPYWLDVYWTTDVRLLILVVHGVGFYKCIIIFKYTI